MALGIQTACNLNGPYNCPLVESSPCIFIVVIFTLPLALSMQLKSAWIIDISSTSSGTANMLWIVAHPKNAKSRALTIVFLFLSSQPISVDYVPFLSSNRYPRTSAQPKAISPTNEHKPNPTQLVQRISMNAWSQWTVARVKISLNLAQLCKCNNMASCALTALAPKKAFCP